MASLSTAAGLRRLLAGALDADSNRVLLGEEASRTGGAGGVTAGLADRFGDRIIDTSIADRGTLGFAVGLALAGKKPLVEVTSTGRLLAGLEVLANAASIAADGEFAVPLVVRVPAGGQAGERIDRPLAQVLVGLPGLTVLCPGTAGAVLGAYTAALRSRSPVVILEPRGLLTRRTRDAEVIEAGRALHRAAGDHLTLVAWGSGVAAALDARETLARDGLSVDVLDLVSLAPLDTDLLGERIRATGRALVVDAPEGPLGDTVLRAVLDAAFLYLEAPPATVAADPATLVRRASDLIHY